MKVDDNIIDPNRFRNGLFKQTGLTNEEGLQLAKEQQDSFLYTGIEKIQVCEQYNDLGHKLVDRQKVRLPVSKEIRKDMLKTLGDYYEGNLSDEELETLFIDYCEQVGVDGKARLLDVYENFINQSRYASNNVCIKKGNEIIKKYGSVSDHDAVYYNADFYYAFERVKQITRNACNRIADVMDWGELDFEELEKNTRFNLDGGFDFNGKWAWNAWSLMNRCTMIDPTMVPPEGFELFYKERKYDGSEVGVMELGINGERKVITVPFQMPRAGVKGYIQKFNVAELYKFTEKDTSNPEEFNRFLANFDVYTRYYFAFNIEPSMSSEKDNIENNLNINS